MVGKKILPGLPSKRADELVVADLKRLVNEMATVMNEADKAGIQVNFNIGKVSPELPFVATIQLTKAM